MSHKSKKQKSHLLTLLSDMIIRLIEVAESIIENFGQWLNGSMPF